MSGRMKPVSDAQLAAKLMPADQVKKYLAGDGTFTKAQTYRLAHTVIFLEAGLGALHDKNEEQAAQITRLQAALREADRNWHDALNSEYNYTCEPEGFISTYEALLPGDMEAPE